MTFARNHHENHILKTSTVPAGVSKRQRPRTAPAQMAIRIVSSLDYVGVMGVEMFLVRAAMAKPCWSTRSRRAFTIPVTGPRTPALTSQFDQHIRAVAGWPLGPVDRHSDAVMENLIGANAEDWHGNPERPERLRLHLYGKAEIRAGRKMGHVNRISPKTR
jgi:5-(carboxyamino)imidazole ribonucleotide synthase